MKDQRTASTMTPRMRWNTLAVVIGLIAGMAVNM
jgi:hypothetical protein